MIEESINMSNRAILITLTFVLINKKAKAIADLDFETELIVKNRDEIGDLGNNINNISTKLKKSLSELKSSNIELVIDHFKQVNDTYGHQVGDLVLIEFAKILISNSRRIDLVGRWGGEEFISILPPVPADSQFI